MAPLYPPLPANRSGFLQVSPMHAIYWEECGRGDGLPIVYLHGGPGGATDARDRQYFDPAVYRSVLFDQRACGRSTPHAALAENTTWHLVADMEALRAHLGLAAWVVFGGSWGAALALAYAQKHPARCLGLVLRGVFALRRAELAWFYQGDGGGADMLFPEFFEAYRSLVPAPERGDLMRAYYRRMTGDDEEVQLRAADAWSRWENSVSKLVVDPDYIAKSDDPKWALAFSRIECHFFVNGAWMEDGQLLSQKEVDKIKHLPIIIVQGRYDVVCPTKTAWELYQALGGESNKNVELNIIATAGHSAHERLIEEALVDATNKFRSLQAAE